MTENRIKEYRGNRGMTQAELAKLVGVRRETIYNLENGRYNPSLSLAWKIAQVFNASIEDIQSVAGYPLVSAHPAPLPIFCRESVESH